MENKIISVDFNNPEEVKEAIEKYGDLNYPLFGTNENGEDMQIGFNTDGELIGVITHTFQKNGWIRVNYFNSNGEPEGETFKGRWR